jgi:hypothetical protein
MSCQPATMSALAPMPGCITIVSGSVSQGGVRPISDHASVHPSTDCRAAIMRPFYLCHR